MSDGAEVAGGRSSRSWSLPESAYAIGFFVAAVVAIVFALATSGSAAITETPGSALFFYIFGLFTISIGYQHPNLGYYSFDRVAQVASILVLGPVDAAWVNGLASLTYPWHRLWKGVPLRDVLFAALFNSALMASLVLICGLTYQAVGGQIPLVTIGGWTPLLLIGLVLSMQALNDLGMLGLLLAGKRDLTGFFQFFSVALELGSGVAAVLVAVIFNSMSMPVLVLLLIVLSLGMLGLKQFASMRQELEQVVAERTRTLEEKTREFEQLAIRDNLTNLYNRRYADEFVERQLAYSRRTFSKSSIALADLDHFKQINDRHSHAMGDDVLKRVATLLTQRCRKSDVIARYGGEEFLICFPETNIDQATSTCEALRRAIDEYDWSAIGLEIPVTISFGIAESHDDIAVSELIKEADRRLYQAKNRGRNRVVA